MCVKAVTVSFFYLVTRVIRYMKQLWCPFSSLSAGHTTPLTCLASRSLGREGSVGFWILSSKKDWSISLVSGGFPQAYEQRVGYRGFLEDELEDGQQMF